MALLLRDALSEFSARRYPSWRYVSERYADNPELQTHQKVLQVALRRALADDLHANMAVSVTA